MMRRCLAAFAALCFTLSASAAEPFKQFPPDYTYANGRILSEKSIQGETRYEYRSDGKLARKIFPKGDTVDFYYDRTGKPTEARFSTGLVRMYQYDRAGRLTAIAGSDGFTKIVRGSNGEKVLILTGPKNFRMDLTAQAKKTEMSLAARMGTRPRAMVVSGGGGGDSCDYWTPREDSFYCAGDAGGGDPWGGGGGASFDPPEVGGPNGNLRYMSCMALWCNPANKNFRDFCASKMVFPSEKESCYTETAKQYFACEADCRYKGF